MKDYYVMLGVLRSASQEEIRKAYQKKAREHHPDRNPTRNTIQQFQEIKEAYEVLYNADKRREYDQSWSVSLLSNPQETATEMWHNYIMGVIQ